jgi:hypothetical protein
VRRRYPPGPAVAGALTRSLLLLRLGIWRRHYFKPGHRVLVNGGSSKYTFVTFGFRYSTHLLVHLRHGRSNGVSGLIALSGPAWRDRCRDDRDTRQAADQDGAGDGAEPEADRATWAMTSTARSSAHPGTSAMAAGRRRTKLVSNEREWKRPAVHHPHRAVAAGHGGRSRVAADRGDTGHPVPLPRQQDPQSPDPQQHGTADTVENPLRRETHGGFGERPGETDQR